MRRPRAIYAATPAGTGVPRSPLPLALSDTLRYYDSFSIDPASGVAGQYFFAANGMYDPNVSGTGHQPMYFDELMALYQHYTVMSSKIKVTVFPGGNPLSFGVLLLGTNTSVTDPLRLSEYQLGSRKYVLGNAMGTMSDLTVTYSFNAERFFNKTRSSMLGDTDYTGGASANPVELAYFCVYVFPADLSTDLSSTLFNIEIEYSAVLTELHLAGTSLAEFPGQLKQTMPAKRVSSG